MTSTYTTYSSKELGGFVVQENRANGATVRAIHRADGTCVVKHAVAGGKYTVIAHSGGAKRLFAQYLKAAKEFCK